MSGPVVRFYAPERVKRVPWKNGLGVTEELAIDPPDAEFAAARFRWRVSMAGVAAPGPFSMFPGYDRVILVVDGGGLRLTHGDDPPIEISRFCAHRFSGDVSTYGVPLEGPVQDANLFLRRGVVDGDLAAYEPIRPITLRLGLGVTFFHAARGAICIRGADVGDWLLPARASLSVSGVSEPSTQTVAIAAASSVAAPHVPPHGVPLVLVAGIRSVGAF